VSQSIVMIQGTGVFAFSLGVCTGCFPSFASECLNRIFHSTSVLLEQIPYA
jgi:hypothetical protein